MIVVFVRHVPSLIHGTQFIGSFFLKMTKKYLGFLLVNTAGEIQNISPTCVNLLNIDQRRITKRVTNIDTCIPGFLKDIDLFRTKAGGNVSAKELGGKQEGFQANVQVACL